MNKSAILLTRDDFREGVFTRDHYQCVFCSASQKTEPVFAHHIIERRLFPDGGYYLDNGATVCNKHHLDCEMTVISTEEVRAAAGITKVVLPPHLYSDQTYDKWGNPVMANGTRLKGELFFDESVNKILDQGHVIGYFTNQVKYPRTHHLPWSEGVNDDDRTLSSMAQFHGKRVIATEKRDGENTSMYSDYFHARSIDGRSHPSRDWAKGFWARIMGDIPEGWRVCGENLYAEHSIAYDDLSTYFEGFSIWNERNVCLDWDTTQEWLNLLGVTSVPILYDGIYDEELIKKLWNSSQRDRVEGYVVRLAGEITYGGFKTEVGKFVRKGHVQTAKHWMQGLRVKPNGLRGKDEQA